MLYANNDGSYVTSVYLTWLAGAISAVHMAASGTPRPPVALTSFTHKAASVCKPVGLVSS